MNNSMHLTNEEVWEFIDTERLPVERKQHLANCSDCQNTIAEAEGIDLGIKSLLENEPAMSFSRNVINRWESSQVNYPFFIAVVAGVFLVLFGLSVVLSLENEKINSAPFLQWTTVIMIVSAFWWWNAFQNREINPGTKSE